MPSPDKIKSSEITDQSLYVNRRTIMRGAILAASVAATGGLYKWLNPTRNPTGKPPRRLAKLTPTTGPSTSPSDASTQPSVTQPEVDENIASAFTTDETRTSIEDITHYNNFYEFSTDKEEVAERVEGFVTRPWTVEVGGLCAKPTTFDLDDILRISAAEERVYRMRCVEAWSMVIPWNGYSLYRLLDRVEPYSDARFVAFQTLFDPKRMPNQNRAVLKWPYVEGLRMDEAMHPLTMLASGIYGNELPAQNGAPLRLVVPWKYGFKGIKSIVKITLTNRQPPTTWNIAGPSEYGFYSNVNSEVDHPRWSQANERRIGEIGRRDTMMFNGYAEQVGHLYTGMDLNANY